VREVLLLIQIKSLRSCRRHDRWLRIFLDIC